MNVSEEVFYHESEEKVEKGDGTMSAVTQNFVYNCGKKQSGKEERTVRNERIKEIKASMAKLLSNKK